MKKLMTMARQFRSDENGAAMVEYSVLIGIITAAAIAIILAVATFVQGAWSTLCSALANSTPGCTMPS